MSLDEDIRLAIDANLTAEVGTRLKERLAQADVDTLALEAARQMIEKQAKGLAQYKDQADQQHALDEREDEVFKREREWDLKAAQLEIAEKYATAARDDMMRVIEHVFKGPGQRLAFDLQGGINGLMNAQGMSQSPYLNASGKVETDSDGG